MDKLFSGFDDTDKSDFHARVGDETARMGRQEETFK